MKILIKEQIMRTYLTFSMLLSLVTLASCGGGNDVASSGASAISATALSSSTTTDLTPATAATAEPKLNGQIDERTGVAAVAAQANIWSPYSNGGCAQSKSLSNGGGILLTTPQIDACLTALAAATSQAQCSALGGYWFYYGGCTN
ncbi:hypothetical protein MCEZE4_00215 [Burkholderiaceae bacterium]|jgi:hypothetical protein